MNIVHLIPHSHAARMAKRDEKRQIILRFLSKEIFSGSVVLAELVNLQKRSISNTLNSMERDGLVVRDQVKSAGASSK